MQKPMQKKNSQPKIGIVSLGCPKALVDSERILTQLRTDGYELTNSYNNAELVIVNTCGFIDSAKEESLSTISEALNENGKVIVTGCMGKNSSEITDLYPNVLNVSGPQQYETVVNAVHQHAPIQRQHDHKIDLVPAQGIKLTPRHYAYLKISEGCNHSCTFCIIPDLRGKLVSRPAGEILAEAERLAAAGVKELLIISQDTSAYGVDIRYQTDFWNGQPVTSDLYHLCTALAQFGIWVRLHYVYPYPNVDKIIPLMAEGKILPYLDIPFQHASHTVLKNMKRPAHAENVLKRIRTWRDICPEITLRSTFIVGFPGETEQDFQELLDFIDEAQLDRVGCFEYSPVEGAKANTIAEHIPDEIKAERRERFMLKQAEISRLKLAQKVGTTVEAIIDGFDSESGVIVGRTKGDAPEIDGVILIEDENVELKPGERVYVNVTDSDEYDLFGRLKTTDYQQKLD